MSPPVSRQALRIVLLGLPGAGKSSLLGALALAAETPDGDAGSPRLIDAPGALTELRQQVEHRHTLPTVTPEQVIPYLVAFEEHAPNAARSHLTEALLIDCDNGVMLEMVNGEQPHVTDRLARALGEADALVLATPAADPSRDEDFAQLEQLLKVVEEERGNKVLVGGVPVLLAVTKCDSLAGPGDTPAQWQAR